MVKNVEIWRSWPCGAAKHPPRVRRPRVINRPPRGSRMMKNPVLREGRFLEDFCTIVETSVGFVLLTHRDESKIGPLVSVL